MRFIYTAGKSGFNTRRTTGRHRDHRVLVGLPWLPAGPPSRSGPGMSCSNNQSNALPLCEQADLARFESDFPPARLHTQIWHHVHPHPNNEAAARTLVPMFRWPPMRWERGTCSAVRL